MMDHASVSRVHATIALTSNGSLLLIDRGSRNGTFVESKEGGWQRVSEAQVKQGNKVKFGVCVTTVREVLGELAPEVLKALTQGMQDAGGGEKRLVVSAPATEVKQKLKRPKRNPLTGEIEEKP